MPIIMPLSGGGQEIHYTVNQGNYQVTWGDTKFVFPHNELEALLTNFFQQPNTWYSLGASMTNPPEDGMGEYIRNRGIGLTPRHASAIAAILVDQGRLVHRGAKPIELRRVIDENQG